MSRLAQVFGERHSLQRRLVVNIGLALTFCFVLASAILTYEFYEHLEENRNDALLREAEDLAAEIVPDAPDLGFDPESLRFRGDEGHYRYTVLDRSTRPLVGGEVTAGIRDQLAEVQSNLPAFFLLPGERAAVALTADRGDETFFVLVSTSVERWWPRQVEELLHEITEEIHWVALGIAVILFAAWLATRSALGPLQKVSEEAQGIGPGSTDVRLSSDQLPSEVVPLVEAVNKAFDRLEQGYRAQRDFSSNVAHEVRTPLAVLLSTINRMQDGPLRRDLQEDVRRLGQIFEQLIDLSRAEALGVTAFEKVDLHQIAVSVARDIGVEAMRHGKRLAVTGATSATVQGNPGLLAIALGNLVRNAIGHTEAVGEIEIRIDQNPAGWWVMDRGPGIPDAQKAHLFERFRRGQSTGRPGAGIGLAIVKSVADAHGATVGGKDRPRGGSAFWFQFS